MCWCPRLVGKRQGQGSEDLGPPDCWGGMGRRSKEPHAEGLSAEPRGGASSGEHWQGAGGGPLTPRVPSQDELPDLIIDEDEEAVGEGAEPPGDPAPNRNRERVGGAAGWGQRTGSEDQKLEPSGAWEGTHSLERVHAERHAHARAVGQEGRQRRLLQQPENQNLVPGKAKKGG